MPQAIDCDNIQPHDSHGYEKEVEWECDGKAQCGAWSHPVHKVVTLDAFWCRGVCDCRMPGRGIHGPGAHK